MSRHANRNTRMQDSTQRTPQESFGSSRSTKARIPTEHTFLHRPRMKPLPSWTLFCCWHLLQMCWHGVCGTFALLVHQQGQRRYRQRHDHVSRPHVRARDATVLGPAMWAAGNVEPQESKRHGTRKQPRVVAIKLLARVVGAGVVDHELEANAHPKQAHCQSQVREVEEEDVPGADVTRVRVHATVVLRLGSNT